MARVLRHLGPALLAGFLLAGCGSSFHGGTPGAAKVEVTSTTQAMAVGDKAQLTATARDAQGARVAGTVFVWSSSNPDIVAVDKTTADTAEVVAKAQGAVTIVAAAPNGLNGYTTLTVQAATPPPPPPTSTLTFEKDIKPLTSACSGCHPAFVPDAGPMNDYKNILDKGFVKPGAPQDSAYYLKPSGQAPHGGGDVWGANAQKVHDWIAEDAPEK